MLVLFKFLLTSGTVSVRTGIKHLTGLVKVLRSF